MDNLKIEIKDSTNTMMGNGQGKPEKQARRVQVEQTAGLK